MTKYNLPVNKRLVDATLEEMVAIHLDSRRGIHEMEDFWVHSTLESAELAMRQSRAIKSMANYAPLLCGFAILDQLGGCYSDAKITSVQANKSGVIRALHNFGNYQAESPESNAFYALRNALVHDAALTGCARDGTWYVFRYDWNQKETIILSKKLWDGSANNINPDIVTMINPRKFTDEISDIKNKVVSIIRHRSGDLRIHQSKEDILHKYIFWIPK